MPQTERVHLGCGNGNLCRVFWSEGDEEDEEDEEDEGEALPPHLPYLPHLPHPFVPDGAIAWDLAPVIAGD